MNGKILLITAIFLMFTMFSYPVLGDAGCSQPVVNELPESVWDPNVIEGDLMLTGEEMLSGAILVNGSLSIVDCTLVIDGAGIVIADGESLSIINSTISPSDDHQGTTIFIEAWGDVTVINSTLNGLLDIRDNIGLIGFYVNRGVVSIQDASFVDCGMLALRDCDSMIKASTIPGAIFLRGNHTLDECIVDSYSITMHGQGSLSISDSTFISDMAFYSEVASISATGGCDLTAMDVSISGSYTTGIYSGGSGVNISNVTIELENALFGLKFDEARIQHVEDVSIHGVHTGISLYECHSVNDVVPLSDSAVHSSGIGVLCANTQRIFLGRFTIDGADIGVRSSAPLDLRDCNFKDNDIGLLLEGGGVNDIENCRFENYSVWAIQEQTWDETDYPLNMFIPGVDSPGRTSWWSYVDIGTVGPGGFPIMGAKLVLESHIGSYHRSPGRIDLIWGYVKEYGTIVDVDYSMTAYWGISNKVIPIRPEMGLMVDVEIPLADPYIEALTVEEGSAIIKVAMVGEGEAHAIVKLSLDGVLLRRETVMITEDRGSEIRVPLGEIPEGLHIIEAELSSQDEYSDASFRANNLVNVEFSKTSPIDTSALASWLIVSILVLMFLIMLMIPGRPKD
ncbi:MAG: NosD domain-containing protein [Candidatus Thermoplasmatota archaeon]|nr:NosD domain-containing protein [Candidatus Thermoplasmatota archaeon]